MLWIQQLTEKKLAEGWVQFLISRWASWGLLRRKMRNIFPKPKDWSFLGRSVIAQNVGDINLPSRVLHPLAVQVKRGCAHESGCGEEGNCLLVKVINTRKIHLQDRLVFLPKARRVPLPATIFFISAVTKYFLRYGKMACPCLPVVG